ncbi:zf-HC2 domain-containing protein [Rhodoferax sp. TH121]|uniref:zf-HC2 domain-containing protein n=1 Tax=Rhodoferax sp. TH121 TaxID=2022803 RepID=UPI0026CC3EF8
MMPFQKSCKEAAALLVAREDRPLGMGDRIALRLHLLACAACPRFERQLLTMRNSLQQWRNYAESEPNTVGDAKKNKN